MPKITDINQFRSRRSPMAPTLRNSGALFWKEPRADATPEELRALPDEEMAAILIKGLFAIYHLSRKHATLPRKVPDYLYDYAKQFEEPIVPAAETLYGHFFHGTPCHPGDEIPDDLFELGMGTARNTDSCVRHGLRLHAFLAAFAGDVPQAERAAHRLFRATVHPGSARLLLPLFETCRRWVIDRQRLKPV